MSTLTTKIHYTHGPTTPHPFTHQKPQPPTYTTTYSLISNHSHLLTPHSFTLTMQI
ncbi:hypothetical protein [Bartonella bacilliformis]|uniref:hypothetical protein n=1 Tax=Bartonella bacilliformis TaxID=774 RepID=UPI0012D360E1|nr:hypothetical protein [Bartonella bacilliformis]